MRSEQEMFDLIINVAKNDERIRAAYLTGSRVNHNAPKDIFQDYDVVYVVTKTRPFYKDRAWIDHFGERLYMQCPDEGAYSSSDIEQSYGWLMQFSDGNRLDLHVSIFDFLDESLATDKMYKILLDKDGCMPRKDKESDEAFHMKKFTENQFLCTCNEFWWCMNNVAKGLWRGEVLYVLDNINLYIRPMLLRMLEFKIGIETEFSVSIGKSAKYMHKWLPTKIWEKYLATYSIAEVSDIWNSVFLMCDLFDEIALYVGEKSCFTYNLIEAENSRGYLEHIRKLPKDSKSIY